MVEVPNLPTDRSLVTLAATNNCKSWDCPIARSLPIALNAGLAEAFMCECDA